MILVPKETKLLLFDCDGTLAETLDIHWSAWLSVLKKYDAGHVPLEFLEQFNGLRTHYIVERINESFRLQLPVGAVSDEKDSAITDLLHLAKPIEPVVALARRESQRRIIAVLSGGERKNVEKTLQAIGCAEIFAAVMCGDDDAPLKNDSNLYLQIAERFGVEPSECFFIEDADVPMNAAASVGYTVFDVRELL